MAVHSRADHRRQPPRALRRVRYPAADLADPDGPRLQRPVRLHHVPQRHGVLHDRAGGQYPVRYT